MRRPHSDEVVDEHSGCACTLARRDDELLRTRGRGIPRRIQAGHGRASGSVHDEVALAIAPCKVGDLIEGGKGVRRKGYVRKIESYHSGFPCIVYIQPFGSRGKLLQQWVKFYYPETITVLPYVEPKA